MQTSLTTLFAIAVVIGTFAIAPFSISAETKPQRTAKDPSRSLSKPQPKAVQPAKAEPKPQAQTPPSLPPETKPETTDVQPVQAEPMGENDRLDFMLTEEVERPQEPSSSGLIIKAAGALALIIALLFVGAWSLKKLGFGGKSPTVGADQVKLAIVSSIALGGGRTLSTIQFGERILLVGSTAQSFTLLAEELPFDNEFTGNPRSVADLLAGDDRSFEDELTMMTGKWEAGQRAL